MSISPTSPHPIVVSIIEDDQVIRKSLRQLIDGCADMICRGAYPDAQRALKHIANDHPDVVLVDIEMPGMSGLEAIPRLRTLLEGADLLVYSIYDDREGVFEALCNGAVGYLTKDVSPERVLNAIREARRGGAPMSARIARMIVASFHLNPDSPLSNRETEVLALLAEGHTYRVIAERLFVDPETVKSHIKRIYQKLDVHSKAEAIRKAKRDRLI